MRNSVHKLETFFQAEECDRQNGQFYDEQMTAIKQIRDDKRHDRCKEVATRSLEKEIRERDGEHCASEPAPESACAEKIPERQETLLRR